MHLILAGNRQQMINNYTSNTAVIALCECPKSTKWRKLGNLYLSRSQDSVEFGQVITAGDLSVIEITLISTGNALGRRCVCICNEICNTHHPCNF